MKTCQYRNHLENLQPWYWVWMWVGSSHSPGRTRAQEFTGKSQQKKSEPWSLAGTRCCPCVTNAFCSSLALIRKVLVSQLVCSCLNGSELLQCDAKNPTPLEKKKFPPLLSFVNTLSVTEVWGKEMQGWTLAFIARKSSNLFQLTLQGFPFWKPKRKNGV